MLGQPTPAAPGVPSSVVGAIASGLGRAFVDAIVVGDFDRLETLLMPDVRFRAITPGGRPEASTAAGARAIIEGWFDGTDRRALLGSTVEPVGDRLAIGYRLELTEDGERRVVEQHVAAVVEGSSFRDVALLCSGFRPLRTALRTPPRRVRHPAPVARLDATGLSCATLTPAISAAVRGLAEGGVLEIVSDDPEAEAGLRSWTRLTGNELVGARPGPGQARHFAIRRAPRDAATPTRKETR